MTRAGTENTPTGQFFILWGDYLKIIITFAIPNGVLAQLVERQVRNLEVRGSTPLCSTNNAVNQYVTVITHKLAMFMRNFLGEQILSYYL